jgi:hypothetical protein
MLPTKLQYKYEVSDRWIGRGATREDEVGCSIPTETTREF